MWPLTSTMLSSPVMQVQTTLASVQELLRQQQQKVQELSHELATAKVLVPAHQTPSPGRLAQAVCWGWPLPTEAVLPVTTCLWQPHPHRIETITVGGDVSACKLGCRHSPAGPIPGKRRAR